METTVRAIGPDEHEEALRVINSAARWYREFLPPEELHEPEMTRADFEREARRMTWYGAFAQDALVGVMAVEYVLDAALLRHAYVLEPHQRQGVGSLLVRHGEREIAGAGRGVERIVVGTYARNHKARGALERLGYECSPDCVSVLRRYYTIPEDRLLGSVTYEKPLTEGPG